MADSAHKSKKQTTLSPAVAAAAKDTKSKRRSHEIRKETLATQVKPARPPARSNEELVRTGLMLLRQQLAQQLDESLNREELEKEYKAQEKTLREHTTKRDNLTKLIKERAANLRLLQEKLETLPTEINVRLELAKVNAALDGETVVEVDEDMQQHMEWQGGQLFQNPTTPIHEEDSPEDGEYQDPLARELLGDSS